MGCSLLFHDKSWQPWCGRESFSVSAGRICRGHLVRTVETIRVSLFQFIRFL
jgi:hypothetical protein